MIKLSKYQKKLKENEEILSGGVFKHKIVIAGNHDLYLDKYSATKQKIKYPFFKFYIKLVNNSLIFKHHEAI